MKNTPSGLARWAQTVRGVREAYQERHTPSGFAFAQADRIQFLSANDWDRATSGGPLFTQRGVLQLLEAHAPPAIQPRYALVYDGREPVAALFALRVDVPMRVMMGLSDPEAAIGVRERMKRALDKLKHDTLGKFALHVLIGGHIFAWGTPGFVCAPGAEPARVWPGVLEGLYRLRNAERRAGQPDFVVLKDVRCDDTSAQRVLKRHNYQIHETEPDMALEIPASWKSYEDYLASLNKKYRKQTKSLEKDCASAGVRFERLSTAAVRDHAPRLRELYLAVQARNAVRLGAPAAEYWPELADLLGEGFRCNVAWHAGTICGFVITLKDGGTAIGYFLGYDPVVNEAAPLYFALLQKTVADAIDFRCRRLTMGQTALDPKARLGAKPIAQCVAVRHRHAVLNPFLPALLRAVIPQQKAPERHPFKDEGES